MLTNSLFIAIPRHPRPATGSHRRDDGGTPRRRKSGDGTLPRRVLNVCVAVRGLTSCRQANHWTPFISMQNHYNLIYREEEREMIPYCREHGIGLTPGPPWLEASNGRLPGSLEGGTTNRSKGPISNEQPLVSR